MRPTFLFFFCAALGLSACSVKYNNPDYVYPPSAVSDTADFPEFMHSKTLAGQAQPKSEKEQADIANLEIRSEALRNRKIAAPRGSTPVLDRAKRLERRAKAVQPSSIDPRRIQRLRSRAAALRAEEL